MVWIVEWSQPGQNEVNVTVWDSEQNALMAVCGEILDLIGSDWDLSDSEAKNQAIQINDLVANGNYRAALREYTDWTANGCDYEYQQFWAVYDRAPLSNPKKPCLLSFSDDVEEEDEDEEDEEEIEEEESYQASSPGATCRGPCKSYSEHAYANKRDGTHVCYQCKMMSQVFGKEIK